MTEQTGDRPFIARFATSIEGNDPQCLRYDANRQISQLLVEGVWLDAADIGPTACRSTRITRVQNETTDDE